MGTSKLTCEVSTNLSSIIPRRIQKTRNHLWSGSRGVSKLSEHNSPKIAVNPDQQRVQAHLFLAVDALTANSLPISFLMIRVAAYLEA